MEFPMQFIRATSVTGTHEAPVPAPYLRRAFEVKEACQGRLLIGALGFYELYLNGRRITKGALAPYISNPDDIVYYDSYELALQAGENVLGLWLGNGFQNNPGGHIWDFDKARFRGAPQVALRLTYTGPDGTERTLESDDSFRTAPSPVLFDDYRFGEHYDARLELPGWNAPGFDDSGWQPALPAPMPRGEARLCEAEPIVVTDELKPVSILPEGDGYRYDFGKNCAGVCRLTIRGQAGQRVELLHGEYLEDGKLTVRNIWFGDNPLVHRDVYICKGEGEETYTPSFTYHGFQYVLVTGITPEQATPDLLTYVVMNSDLKERGGFTCSDPTVNTLQELTRRSDLANFYYFPTDCPQREKNGWTADAALSSEHLLLNLSPETSYREWMRNICKAMDDRGALPGIVPTGGWGFHWGNGPAWDNVLLYLPYFVYLYRGDKTILEESAASILRYLHYLTTRVNEEGLIKIGLGDWCPPARGSDQYKAPLEFTDTVLSMDIAEKAAYIFGVLGMAPQQTFAASLAAQFRAAVRERLVDFSTMTAAGNCQTSQAMALFYGVFEPGERPAAFDRLLRLIEEQDGHMDTGVLGGRVIFHVLTDFGRSDLAFNMIVRPDFPSYGNWVARGATSLWEDFQPEGGDVTSHNHHFWGDISSWFIQALAGIRFNPHRRSLLEADIRPSFVPQLDSASGFHLAPAGKIASSWVREGGEIRLTVEFPADMTGRISLEPGYVFDDGLAVKPAASGEYRIHTV